jgi:DNA-binding transcriptional regulator YiaG
MPNPSGKMNDHEREICLRVKAVRESVNRSEKNFAKLLWITRDRLAGIEYCRTPLKFTVAVAMATVTGYSLKWLADGTGPQRGPLPSPYLIKRIPPHSLFSTAWDKWFRPFRDLQNPVADDNQRSGGATTHNDVEDYLTEEVLGCLASLPPQLRQNFFGHIAKGCSDFVGMNLVAIHEFEARERSLQKNSLTHGSQKSNTGAGMKTEIQELIEKVKRKASKPGDKAALAKYLHVAPARISEWLSGIKEPGGNYTLLLQKWVYRVKPSVKK